MDAHPAVVGAAAVGLGAVDADPDRAGEAHLGAQIAQLLLDADRTVDRSASAVERDEEAVAGRVDDLPSPCRDALTEHVIVLAQDRLPGLVAESLGEAGRTDDVGEHERLGRCRGPAAAVSQVLSLALGCFEVDPRPELGERGECGFELEVGVVAIVDAPQRAGQDRAGSGDFIRRTHLPPALDRDAQLADRPWRIAFGQQDATEGDMAA